MKKRNDDQKTCKVKNIHLYGNVFQFEPDYVNKEQMRFVFELPFYKNLTHRTLKF